MQISCYPVWLPRMQVSPWERIADLPDNRIGLIKLCRLEPQQVSQWSPSITRQQQLHWRTSHASLLPRLRREQTSFRSNELWGRGLRFPQRAAFICRQIALLACCIANQLWERQLSSSRCRDPIGNIVQVFISYATSQILQVMEFRRSAGKCCGAQDRA